MQYIKNRIIHRFIRDITEYLEGGTCYGQVLPTDTQVYADYSEEAGQLDPEGNPKIGLHYVIGDGVHTYTEIRDGYGENEYNKEYVALLADSSVLKNVYLHNLKNGQFLRWDEKTNNWININLPPVPYNVILESDQFECGSALNDHETFINGGNAGSQLVNYLNCGGVAKTNYNIEFIKWI